MKLLKRPAMWIALPLSTVAALIGLVTSGLAGTERDHGVEASPVGGSAAVELAALAASSVEAPPATARLRGDSKTIAEIAQLLTSGDTGVPSEWLPGDARLERGRLLLSNVGTTGRDVYAFPTTRGRVCVVVSAFSAGCVHAFTREHPVDVSVGDPDQAGIGESVIVAGIAPNEVVKVVVLADDGAHRAQVRNNAFFYQLADNAVTVGAVNGLVVGFRDGTSTTMTFPDFKSGPPSP